MVAAEVADPRDLGLAEVDEAGGRLVLGGDGVEDPLDEVALRDRVPVGRPGSGSSGIQVGHASLASLTISARTA